MAQMGEVGAGRGNCSPTLQASVVPGVFSPKMIEKLEAVGIITSSDSIGQFLRDNGFVPSFGTTTRAEGLIKRLGGAHEREHLLPAYLCLGILYCIPVESLHPEVLLTRAEGASDLLENNLNYLCWRGHMRRVSSREGLLKILLYPNGPLSCSERLILPQNSALVALYDPNILSGLPSLRHPSLPLQSLVAAAVVLYLATGRGKFELTPEMIDSLCNSIRIEGPSEEGGTAEGMLCECGTLRDFCWLFLEKFKVTVVPNDRPGYADWARIVHRLRGAAAMKGKPVSGVNLGFLANEGETLHATFCSKRDIVSFSTASVLNGARRTLYYWIHATRADRTRYSHVVFSREMPLRAAQDCITVQFTYSSLHVELQRNIRAALAAAETGVKTTYMRRMLEDVVESRASESDDDTEGEDRPMAVLGEFDGAVNESIDQEFVHYLSDDDDSDPEDYRERGIATSATPVTLPRRQDVTFGVIEWMRESIPQFVLAGRPLQRQAFLLMLMLRKLEECAWFRVRSSVLLPYIGSMARPEDGAPASPSERRKGAEISVPAQIDLITEQLRRTKEQFPALERILLLAASVTRWARYPQDIKTLVKEFVSEDGSAVPLVEMCAVKSDGGLLVITSRELFWEEVATASAVRIQTVLPRNEVELTSIWEGAKSASRQIAIYSSNRQAVLKELSSVTGHAKSPSPANTCVIVTRCSSEDIAAHTPELGTLNAQAEILRRLAMHIGLDCCYALEFNGQGLSLSGDGHRDMYSAVLELCEKVGAKHVLFMSLDRCTRNFAKFDEFLDVLKRRGITLAVSLMPRRLSELFSSLSSEDPERAARFLGSFEVGGFSSAAATSKRVSLRPFLLPVAADDIDVAERVMAEIEAVVEDDERFLRAREEVYAQASLRKYLFPGADVDKSSGVNFVGLLAHTGPLWDRGCSVENLQKMEAAMHMGRAGRYGESSVPYAVKYKRKKLLSFGALRAGALGILEVSGASAHIRGLPKLWKSRHAEEIEFRLPPPDYQAFSGKNARLSIQRSGSGVIAVLSCSTPRVELKVFLAGDHSLYERFITAEERFGDLDGYLTTARQGETDAAFMGGAFGRTTHEDLTQGNGFEIILSGKRKVLCKGKFEQKFRFLEGCVPQSFSADCSACFEHLKSLAVEMFAAVNALTRFRFEQPRSIDLSWRCAGKEQGCRCIRTIRTVESTSQETRGNFAILRVSVTYFILETFNAAAATVLGRALHAKTC